MMLTKEHVKATAPAFGRVAIYAIIAAALIAAAAYWATDGFTNHFYGIEWVDDRYEQKSDY